MNDDTEYNNVFCTLIRGVIERTEGLERENLLRRLYLESPQITDDAIELLKGFITIMGSAITVVNLMKDLVMRRPTKKLNCLNFLLEFCAHDVPEGKFLHCQLFVYVLSTVFQSESTKTLHLRFLFIFFIN